ncbi:hypothetical protein H8356DRAFT_1643193 [Neocallimastix lanati (nom. inval.)]|nr:hypothetical protein H8356DRAFT_1643193 [Neocallimastix sp. JGI-2020a]
MLIVQIHCFIISFTVLLFIVLLFIVLIAHPFIIHYLSFYCTSLYYSWFMVHNLLYIVVLLIIQSSLFIILSFIVHPSSVQ